MSNQFDDFDTQIQCDELIPSHFEDSDLLVDDSDGLTGQSDDALLDSQWREECFEGANDENELELCAVFGADDEDNYPEADPDIEDGDFYV